MSRKRALIAGGLGLIYPGLGHLYLREWVRGLAWLGMAIFTAALVIPESAVTAFETGGLDGLIAASRTLPATVVLALSTVRVLNAIDAAWLARSLDRAAAAGPSCPHCGGELDEDLSFCPWCTARLEDHEEAGEAVTSR